MHTVTSRDGTPIAFDRLGDGPAVVLISGGSVDRSSNVALATALATDFTVLNYDRRGRGPSGDTPPYAIEREIEDLAAVIDAAGGAASVYGSSSGGVLGLRAAASLPSVERLLLWEPPFIGDPAARPPADQVEQYERMVGEGRRGDAVEYFMSRIVGLPPEFVAFARTQPFWAASEALAHTLAYDARIMGDYSLPVGLAASVEVPALVIAGGASFPFMLETANALAAALPNGRVAVLDGQSHDVDPAVLAPVLREFLHATAGVRS